eukprot:COSAG02_NODE_12542_length_1528_cov_1.000000_1_plen_420_part_01
MAAMMMSNLLPTVFSRFFEASVADERRLRALTVAQLRQVISAAGLSDHDCIDKDDLVARACEAERAMARQATREQAAAAAARRSWDAAARTGFIRKVYGIVACQVLLTIAMVALACWSHQFALYCAYAQEYTWYISLEELSREVFAVLLTEVVEEESRELAMTEPLTEEDREAAALLELLDSSETRMSESEAERAAAAEEVAAAAAAAERKRVREAARQTRLAAERRKKDAAAVRAAAIEKRKAEEHAAERAKTERIEAAKRAKARQADAEAKARQAAADAARVEEMKAKADALKNSKLGMGVGFGTGVDFNKRLRGRAGRAKAVVAADNQLEEMQKTRRQLRRARKKWGKSIFEAEQSRRLGEQESDTLLYNISRIGRLRAYQEEQLLKLAELTAVHDPDLLLAAIEAVEEKDAEACMN